MKDLNNLTRKDLLVLPHKDWQEDKTYDSLLIFSTREKHDSGFACMYIIGILGGKPVEIATACSDDIEWKMPTLERGGLGQIRTDCLAKSGILHFWSNYSNFRVGCALSSIDIELVKKPNVPK